MGGVNPYITPADVEPPKKKYRITFLPSGKTFEVDPERLPYGRNGLAGSILDIAYGADRTYGTYQSHPIRLVSVSANWRGSRRRRRRRYGELRGPRRSARPAARSPACPPSRTGPGRGRRTRAPADCGRCLGRPAMI